MTWEEFTVSLTKKDVPENLTVYLRALWYDAQGNWNKAHEVAQDIEDKTGSWIHAYLHRKEGDTGNAAYWYRRAAKPMPSCPLRQEHEEMVRALLK